MKIINKLLPLFYLSIPACNSAATSNKASASDSAKSETSVTKDSSDDYIDEESYKAYLTPKDTVFANLKFTFGYAEYSQKRDKADNKGYVKVFDHDKLIFTDSFTGEGEIYVDTMGYHTLAGKKLFFKMQYGIEACDYAVTTKYYVIQPGNKISCIAEGSQQAGSDGYAARFHTLIFPEDSGGMANTILFVDALEFNEHDQPNRYDTTYISFTEKSFTSKKRTDNISKAK